VCFGARAIPIQNRSTSSDISLYRLRVGLCGRCERRAPPTRQTRVHTSQNYKAPRVREDRIEPRAPPPCTHFAYQINRKRRKVCCCIILASLQWRNSLWAVKFYCPTPTGIRGRILRAQLNGFEEEVLCFCEAGYWIRKKERVCGK
jgi:hypothetical protein